MKEKSTCFLRKHGIKVHSVAAAGLCFAIKSNA